MRTFLLLILSLCSALWVTAQELNVLKTDVPENVPFAQPFTARVVLSHPRGQTVTWDKESIPAEFAVGQVQLEPVGVDSTQASFTLFPFTLDKSTFTVSFSLAGNPAHTVQAQAPLTVSPVKVFEDDQLREIRPPHRVVDWVTWLCILLALVALVCLLIFGWRRWHKEKTKLLAAPVDNRPPHVIALSQIDALINSGLWESKQYKVFYITLTDILRTYLQRACGLDVSSDTSADLLRRLKTVPNLTAQLQQIRVFLSSGDLVKFAKQIPTEDTRNRDITILRTLIEATTPKPAEPTVRQEVHV